MNKYDSYKDSGVEWIGEIPSHWDRTKGKYILEILTGNYPSEIIENEEGIPFVKVDDLNYTQEYHFLKGSNLIINPSGLTPLDGNIIIFPKRGMTIYTNKVVVCTFKSFIDPNLMGVKILENCNTLYVKYLIQSRGLGDICDSSTIPQINNKHIYPLEFPYPPLPEQNQIVVYLDTKTTLIDTLIQKTQEKITLLREKRTSLINHTVTKGLNPDVEMKESGVEWIGEIPGHWDIKRVGYISKLLTGNPWKSELFDFDEGVKIVRGENVSEGFLRWGDRTRYWKENVDNDSIFFLKDGDIVISMDGSKVGKNYVQIKEEDLPLLLHQRMCRVRVNETYDSRYVLYFIGSDIFKYYIDISKTDPMIPHITQKNIYDFKISIPSISEQHQIIEYLDEQTQLIDTLIQEEEKRVELLKEYRQTLISDVVTGKIKING